MNQTSFPLLPLLGLLFVGLKLGRVIDWPWVWVLAPFWAGFGLLFALMLLLAGVAACRANGRRRGGWR